jgi:HEAT repeat protein
MEFGMWNLKFKKIAVPIVLLILFLSGCAGEVDIPALIEKAKSGDARAGRKLVDVMGSADRETALTAYRALLQIGAGSQPWLMEGLRSGKAAVVEASSAVLGNMGSKASVPALIRLLEQADKRPYAAALALGEIGDFSAVPHLVKALDSENTGLRKAAVRALVKMGPETIRSVLPLIGQDDDEISQRAGIRVVGELRAGAGVELLISVTGSNRDAAAWALGRIGDPEGFDALLGALSDERWPVRREAAEALGSLEDPAAVPALTTALDDVETVVREWAARSLEVLTGRKVLYVDDEGTPVPPYNLYR